MSISLIRACACGLRRVWPQSIPAAWRSLEYANSPVTFGMPSARLTLSPTRPSSSRRVVVGVVVVLNWASAATPHPPPHPWVGIGLPPATRGRRYPLPTHGSANGMRGLCDDSSPEPSCATRGQPHGVEDLRVARAATEIARERLADLVLVRLGLVREQVRGRDHEPGCAETALHGARLDEGLLNAMEPAVVGQALDRHHLVAVGLSSEDETRADERPVQQNRARPALALLARVLRPGQLEPLAQRVEQALAGPDLGLALLAVDREFHPHSGNTPAAAVGMLLSALPRGPDAEAIADDLPVYPGARLVNRSSQRYDDWSRDVY